MIKIVGQNSLAPAVTSLEPNSNSCWLWTSSSSVAVETTPAAEITVTGGTAGETQTLDGRGYTLVTAITSSAVVKVTSETDLESVIFMPADNIPILP